MRGSGAGVERIDHVTLWRLGDPWVERSKRHKFLEPLELHGCIATIDSMGCQTEITLGIL